MHLFIPIQTEKRATAAHSKEFHAEFNGTLHANYETDELWNGSRTGQNANWEISVWQSIKSLRLKHIFKIVFSRSFHPTASIIYFRVIASTTVTIQKIMNGRIPVATCQACCYVFAIENGNSHLWRNLILCSNTVSWCVSSYSLASSLCKRWTVRAYDFFGALFSFLISIFCVRRNGTTYWLLNAIAFLVLFLILSITWFKKLWVLLSPINEEEPSRIDLPENPVLRILFKASKAIIRSAITRYAIYLLCICVLTLSALIHLVECDSTENDRNTNTTESTKYSPCFNTWVRCRCGAMNFPILFDPISGHYTKFDFGPMHEFPVRPHPFSLQIVCGRFDCGHLFVDHFWAIWFPVWGG